MATAGLDESILEQLELLPFVRAYFEAIAAHPDPEKASLDSLLNPIANDNLKYAIRHIGRTGELPDVKELRELRDRDLGFAYRRSVDMGWMNLRFLHRAIKSKFMDHPEFGPRLRYARQVAAICKGCGEYKLSGMFEFGDTNKAHTGDLIFKKSHIIDPKQTSFDNKGRKNDHGFLVCHSCGHTQRRGKFELKFEGPYANASEFFYPEPTFKKMLENRGPYPPLQSARIRVKEIVDEFAKIAYHESIDGDQSEKVYQALKSKLDSFEQQIGPEEFHLFTERDIYDKYGVRLVTAEDGDCYWFMDWFSNHYEISRVHDYLKNPKPSTGYSSLHFTAWNMPTDPFTDGQVIPVEFQITTYDKHKHNESPTGKRSEEKDRGELVRHNLSLAVIAMRYCITGM